MIDYGLVISIDDSKGFIVAITPPAVAEAIPDEADPALGDEEGGPIGCVHFLYSVFAFHGLLRFCRIRSAARSR